jgi:hypothetical protein
MVLIPPKLLTEWADLFLEQVKAFAAFPDESALATLYMVSKALLAAPLHGGRQRAATTERLLMKRFALWRTGHFSELWKQVKTAWTKKPRSYEGRPTKPDSTFSRARMFADLGLPGKACRLLCSRGVADPSEFMEAIRNLFPQTSECIAVPEPAEVDIDVSDVVYVLRRLPRGIAAGASGLRSDHLLQLLRLRKSRLPDELVGCMAGLIKTRAAISLLASQSGSAQGASFH